MPRRRLGRLARSLALAGVAVGSLALPVVGAEPAAAIVGGYEVAPEDYPQFVPLRTRGAALR